MTAAVPCASTIGWLPSSLETMKFGNWSVVKQLGEGHFGAVYKVRRPVLDDPDTFQWGALKVLHPGSDTVRQQTMINEITKISQLAHGGLSDFIDHGVETDGNKWFVMRFIEGENLEEWITQHGPMSEPQWLSFTKQLLSILAYTRNQNLSHLDIKPDNIIRDESGRYFLVDFGLSSRTFGERINIHNNGWSAPEQFNGQALESPATDVFSAALAIYFARTGKHAWGSPNPFEYPTNVQTKAPNLNGLEHSQQMWLQPAFAKDPANRPSAQKLLDELDGIFEQIEANAVGVVNPTTWGEFESVVLQLLDGQVTFELYVSTSNHGEWIFEDVVDLDEVLLYLYSGDSPQRALKPDQRKRLFDSGWRNDSLGAQRLVFDLGEFGHSSDFITAVIQNALNNGLGLSIENVTVRLAI